MHDAVRTFRRRTVLLVAGASTRDRVLVIDVHGRRLHAPIGEVVQPDRPVGVLPWVQTEAHRIATEEYANRG